ncbi:MAG: hypothetical protein ACYS29_14550 [Planctomycetota bacterium]|jgi:hypothetical protein
MNRVHKNTGSVLLIAIFVIGLLSAVVIGMLQVNTEELQIMPQLRGDAQWSDGFTDKSFWGGIYSVSISTYSGAGASDVTIVSTATSSHGFVGRVAADVTLSGSAPHIVRIDNLRINE